MQRKLEREKKDRKIVTPPTIQMITLGAQAVERSEMRLASDRCPRSSIKDRCSQEEKARRRNAYGKKMSEKEQKTARPF